jgi:hypothetical protein
MTPTPELLAQLPTGTTVTYCIPSGAKPGDVVGMLIVAPDGRKGWGWSVYRIDA